MWPEIRIINEGIPNDYSVAEAKAQGITRWKDWTCTVGTRSLYIDFDGVVFRGPCRVGRPLGHILTGWNLPEDEIVCTRETCDCGSSIKLRKRFDDDLYMVPLSTEPFHVQWDLGRRCNFDCSYCWPTSHDKTSKWWTLEQCIKAVDHIHEQNRGNMIQFNFAGGEPTLHPNFLDLCAHIKHLNSGHTIHVQTNGTAHVNKLRILARLAEISISVHFEFTKADKLIRAIAGILAERGKLEVKMMVSPKTFKKMQTLKRQLSEIPGIQHARVIVSPLRDPDTNELMDYTPEQTEEFGDVEF